jgi:hypothetical protein
MNWTVIVAEAAQKQLARFPAKDLLEVIGLAVYVMILD